MRSHLLILLFLPFLGFAQVWDDFDDGDFTQNPSWIGDISNFVVNNDGQLQLYWEGSQTSSLKTAYNLGQETEWRFWIKLSFSPSSNNYARFYLASDELLNTGYFIQFGERGSDDALELFRQNGETLTSICRGTQGLISSSFAFWVRIRKDALGEWILETDPSGNGAYQIEASGFDNSIQSSAFLGVNCKYTASNSTKFYFDDIYAGPFVIDEKAPELSQLNITSSNTLDLLFDEALEEQAAETKQNYFVFPNISYPVVATLDEENAALVHLTFDRAFPNGEWLTITIENISDLAGNTASPITREFSHFTPDVHDIQINEIMADPNPPVELPDWEYLELYNRSDWPANLSGWSLTIGSSEKEFENVSIEAGAYLILGDEDAANEFTFSGPFYGFSSFALTNAGQTIILQNPEGQIISTISYTDEWYEDPNKNDGGWSLEQIDPENPCGGIANWSVSESQYGGSPGAKNSVFAENPDFTAPYAQRVEIIDSITMMLIFSEPMDSVGLNDKSAYEIDHDIGQPIIVSPTRPDYRSVELGFEDPFHNSNIYTLQITTDLSDCVGNIIDKSRTVSFGLPQETLPGDVVINEILFNPKDEYVKGVDFVEIFNRSNKIIDLGKMVLASRDEESGELESPKAIADKGFLFFPQQYMVLTTDPSTVQTQYYTQNTDAFLEMQTLPSFNNDAGTAVIASNGLQTIDQMVYSEEMQYPLLTSYDGVSLERLNPERPSDDQSNWHSAAEDVDFATPGYQNSQFNEQLEASDPITIDPEIFSPDMDGRDDVLNIHYQFDMGGNNCNIIIYDSRGRPVRTLVNNEVLGTSGQFSWDGLNDDHQKANIGIYVIWVEIFDLDGKQKVYKNTAVLATQF